MRELIITIDEFGSIEIEAEGFSGQASADCLEAAAPFEEALGEVKKREFKPEHHGQVQQHQRQ